MLLPCFLAMEIPLPLSETFQLVKPKITYGEVTLNALVFVASADCMSRFSWKMPE